MNATNTFQNGLVTDSHPLAVSNDTLTNCLNGTLITYNGNELILQNDVGNSKIIYKDKDNIESEVKLTEGFIPIGMKSFGSIIYIFSHNPITLEGEIGTFPSPDYDNYSDEEKYNIHKLLYTYKPLHNLIKSINNKELQDLRTKEFNFDLEHPLLIDFLISYDESVNIIFNDGKNIPRLINNGFAPYGDNEVKIIKMDQNVLETNIYEEDNFKYNTSLIRICNSIVQINFKGELENGNLSVGNYVFYFKVADSDDNESDFIGLSGLVVCHKGKLNDPKSIDGGVAAENSGKTVKFELRKIPRQFSRLYVYYSRYSSTQNGVLTTEYKKITKYFDLSSVKTDGYRRANINITGYDDTIDIGLVDLNPRFTNPLSVNALAISENILFLANIKNNAALYDRLKYFSRNYVTVEPAESETADELLYDVSCDYQNRLPSNVKDPYGYYNINNIYNKVGYWPEEYYRFGIVYILNDYTTTRVFNIKGLTDGGSNQYGVILFKRQYFKRYFKSNTIDNNSTYVLLFPKFKIDLNTEQLPEEVIGCIFVRQKRIKNILGQAIQIGTDSAYSHLPVLWCGESRKWVAQSFINNGRINLADKINTFVEVDDVYVNMVDPYEGDEGSSIITSIPETIPIINTTRDHLSGQPVPEDLLRTISYFRHDAEGKYPYIFSPRHIKLGASWISNLSNSVLDVFGNKSIYKNAAIMPEFELNLEYYSNIFSGGTFSIDKIATFSNIYFPEKTFNAIHTTGETYRCLNIENVYPVNPLTLLSTQVSEVNIIAVKENTTVKANDEIFKSVAGNAYDPSIYETPFTSKIYIEKEIPAYEPEYDKDFYEGIGWDHDARMGKGRTDYTFHTRGIFSPYLGIASKNTSEVFDDYSLINIKSSTAALFDLELEIRLLDYSDFFPISERIELASIPSVDGIKTIKSFRGDCYIGNFTHRMLRNFIDPEFPIQDKYALIYSWVLGNRVSAYDKSDPANKNNSMLEYYDDTYVLEKDTYVLSDSTKTYLNRSDINSIPLGHWLTFKYYSSLNPCMRSTDGSNISERATFNLNRKFYPLYDIDLKTNINKLSDSYIYNEGYEQSLGKQIFVLYPEVPAIKDEFSNRIMYSNIDVESKIINNLRTFREAAFEDYTRQYGKIIKLVPYGLQFLIIIFEHGIGYVLVNEKAVVSELASKAVYLETNKVIGDLTVIHEKYGSLWPDSVISTPTGIYGIDTTTKKIWRVYNGQFECISDLKVNKFLRDNLVTNEISNLVNVLTFNVKTHYNAHKQDIMFTFHRNLEDGSLMAWNLCYNEVTKKMTTFYSWVPIYSENINKTYYSFLFDPKMAYLYINNNFKNYYYEHSLYLWEHNKENNWCNWYGEQHPFEFEYVVNANPNFLKIFNNLEIISNKAVPESFHFEIVGESYDFSKDKKNMYHRLEATKAFYDWCMSRVLNGGSDKLQYDSDAVKNTYLTKSLLLNQKSTIFPLTVKRLDYNNIIYDIYKLLTSNSYDYEDLSGSEIVYDPTTNDYLINTHIKAYPKGNFIWLTICRVDDEDVNTIANYYVKRGIEIRIDGEYLLKKVKYDPRLCNCKYVEDSWKVQIPSINYFEKNEDWNKTDGKPPINLVMDPLPDELAKELELPLNSKYPIDTEQWKSHKQTKIRDKYIKIKIRYSGDDLAIISGIINIFKETYN